MPGEGFFYTYLTNFSDNLVTFDNLTIRHKQGTLRNIHEYYPYGLEYWRSGTKLYDRGDQFSEFHHREWELDGIEMNRFAARWYDPVIARWHAPDPLEQMHSPYVALCGDPANFVDPDGRAGIHLSDWTKGCIKDAFLMYGGAAVGGAAMVGIGKVLQGVEFVGSTLQGVLNVVTTAKGWINVIKNVYSCSKSFGAMDNVCQATTETASLEYDNPGNNGGDFGNATASVQHDLVGPIDRPNVNQPAYKGGTYGFIALITFGSNLGNSSINSNTRNFSTNGSFINYFQGKKIEQWYQTNGSSGIAPYAPPSDNIRYQTLFYRVQYKDPWGSPWAYAIDFIPYPPIPAPIQGRGGNTLPVSFNLELSKPVTLEDFFSFPPRFPMELRPDRYGRISEDQVQGGAKVVARTALRLSLKVKIYGGNGTNSEILRQRMRNALISFGISDSDILDVDEPPLLSDPSFGTFTWK